MPALLAELDARGLRLGTGTAKRTPTAQAILAHHGLEHWFAVVNGSEAGHPTKTATLTRTLAALGSPDRAGVLMVGDRHSDVTAALDCGVIPVAAAWGYGSREELTATGALLRDEPRDLLGVPGLPPSPT